MTEPHKPAAALNDLPLAELDPDIAEVLAGELARQAVPGLRTANFYTRSQPDNCLAAT